jgi:ParB family chromosome partitioning protein
MTITVQSEYRNLPLDSLTESSMNPRRSFDQTALNELADYVPGHIISLLCC